MAKVLVSIADGLLERLDREAVVRGVSRSALITELVNDGLGETLGPGATSDVQQALAELDDLFRRATASYEDSTDAIRAERNKR